MTKDKAFYHTFFKLFAVLSLQNIIVLSVNLIDNIMLGGYSEPALSGATIVNQIQYLLLCIVGEVGTGIVVLASQYWGQQRTGPIKKVAATAVWTSLAVSALFLLAVSLAPTPVLRLFTKDAAILAEGRQYLNILRFTFPVFALSSTLLAMLRAVETVRLAVVVSAVTLGLNTALNYGLIYGRWGLPEMGSAGAALATLLSRVAELAIILAYVFRADRKLRMRPADFTALEPALVKDFFRTARPLMFNGVLWGLSVALQTAVLGHLSTSAIAANSIAVNCVMVLKIVADGSASASSVIIGKTIGAGRFHNIRPYSRTLQVIYLLIGLFIFASVMLIRDPVLSLYNISAETRALARQIFFVLAVTSIGMSYQMSTIKGIIMGGGDTRFNTVNNIICIWCIMLPVSMLAAFVWHWPPIAVVFCLNSDQLYKCIPAAIKANRYHWYKQLTR